MRIHYFNRSIEHRFWEKVMPEPNSGCWIWLDSLIQRGYGQLRVNGKGLRAHRIAHELLKGPIPSKLTIDHLCRNHWCVNPDHLEAVTQKENILRGTNQIAINAKQTHCSKGHEFSFLNTYISKKGHRFCRECNRINCKRQYLKKKQRCPPPVRDSPSLVYSGPDPRSS